MALKELILILAVMLTVLVLTGTGYAMASPPAEEWNRTYEISGITSVESLQQTADSGYIIAGNTKSNVGRNSDINLLKIGPTGSEQWNRTFGGTFTYDCVKFVLHTLDGGYLIAGSTSACRDNCPDDVWLIKVNPQGQEQWNLTLGGTGDEEMAFVQQTTDGGYFLIGNTDSHANSSDIWFVKVNSNGNMQWNNTFGGIGQDKAYSVCQVPGGYIIAGMTQSGVNHNDLLLVKTDSNGKEQWYRTFGGVGAEFNPSVGLSPDGGYILGGGTFSFDDADYWLIKTDADGNMQWDRTFKGRLDSFLQTPDGGYIIKGDLYGPPIIKIDSNGTEQWDIRMKCNELNSVLQTSDGGYILAGIYNSKLLLVKLMAEGSSGIPAEPEGENAPTDGEPVQTPDMPGFGAAVAVIGLLVWVGLAGRRR